MLLVYSISVGSQNEKARFDYSILKNLDGTNVNKQESKYDNDNNEILRLYSQWNGKEWKEVFKYEYDYDYQGNLAESAMYNCDSLGNWTGISIVESGFKADGNLSWNKYYTWTPAQQWNATIEENFVYNENNEKTNSYLLFLDENHEWKMMDNGYYAFEYEYDKSGNCIIQRVYNVFTNSIHQKHEYRYDTGNNLISSLLYRWNDHSLIKHYWFEYKYDINGNQTEEIFSHYNEKNQEWQPFSKYAHSYDENSRLTGVSYFYWNQKTQDWDGHYNYEYNNDEYGNPVSINLFIWRGKEWILNEIVTYYYENQYFTGNVTEEIPVTIYPNPATNFINISGVAGAKIVITDTAGRILFIRNNIRDTETIPTSSWTSGIYLVNIQKDGKQITKKIVKQ